MTHLSPTIRTRVAAGACLVPLLLAGCVPPQGAGYAGAPMQPGYAPAPPPGYAPSPPYAPAAQPYAPMAQPGYAPRPPAYPAAPPPPGGGNPGMLPPSVARLFPDPNDPSAPHLGRLMNEDEMGTVGQVMRINAGPTGCQTDMVLNQERFLASVPTLVRFGILNPQITQSFAQRHTVSTAIAFTLQAATIMAHQVVNTPGGPFGCHFRQAIQISGQTIPLFEFDMDRNNDSGAPWPQLMARGFSSQNVNQFLAATPSFSLAPGVFQQVQNESGA